MVATGNHVDFDSLRYDSLRAAFGGCSLARRCGGSLQHARPVVSFTRRMKFDKLKFVVLLYWRGSALAFPSGEGAPERGAGEV